MLKPSTCFRKLTSTNMTDSSATCVEFCNGEAVKGYQGIKVTKEADFALYHVVYKKVCFSLQSLSIRSMLCQWKRMLFLFASSTRNWTARMCQKPRWRKSITGKQIKSQLQTRILNDDVLQCSAKSALDLPVSFSFFQNVFVLECGSFVQRLDFGQRQSPKTSAVQDLPSTRRYLYESTKSRLSRKLEQVVITYGVISCHQPFSVSSIQDYYLNYLPQQNYWSEGCKMNTHSYYFSF